MLILFILLAVLLGHYLSQKGKQASAERRIERMKQAKSQERKISLPDLSHLKAEAREHYYRKELEREGYDDDLIAIILPIVMDGK